MEVREGFFKDRILKFFVFSNNISLFSEGEVNLHPQVGMGLMLQLQVYGQKPLMIVWLG